MELPSQRNEDHQMKVVAYIRVSTKGQGDSGLGLEAQRDYIKRAAQQNDWEVIGEFVDVVSGKLAIEDRPEGAKALALCKEQNAQLVVAKLDRLSRDVHHIAGLMKTTKFKVATMPHAQTFELHLYAALAQQEREFISGRTREALAALQSLADAGDAESIQKIKNRSSGLVSARAAKKLKAATTPDIPKINPHHQAIATHVEQCLYRGCKTLQSLADCLNEKGELTSRGGQWNPTTVRRLMIALNVSF
jgi:DNA invertase Pin-like site-specific DNA recombinase